MNGTPGAERLHIGIFGRTNSGKSTFINALTGQQVSIVADLAGTTTDPVYRAMELHPLGPCTLIDTAGFGDVTALGKERQKKTGLAAERADIAVLIVSAEEAAFSEETVLSQEAVFSEELAWYEYFRGKSTPVLFVVNKADRYEEQARALFAFLAERTKEEPLLVSALTGFGMEQVRPALARKMPEDFGQRKITGGLVSDGDLVLLVMPVDIQAPKGRLILPQVQTLRELLDKRCLTACCTADRLKETLAKLAEPPKLIITDSQVFPLVYEGKPKESMLTSFSVLFAAYKGDLPCYVAGARQLDALQEDARVLIAECCTHAPLAEDIGRVKLPRLLRRRVGESLTVDVAGGTDFPEDLRGYDLIIQCGACMFNRSYVLTRIARAKEQRVPITNYGVAIAHLTGIIDKIALPEGCGALPGPGDDTAP